MTDLHAAINEAEERKAFEAWAKTTEDGGDILWHGPDGANFSDLAWEGWQARAALSAPPQEDSDLTVAYMVGYSKGKDAGKTGPAVPQGYKLVPIEPSHDWLCEVAVLARVWPRHNKRSCPPAILEAIKKYHSAMLAAPSPQEQT